MGALSIPANTPARFNIPVHLLLYFSGSMPVCEKCVDLLDSKGNTDELFFTCDVCEGDIEFDRLEKQELEIDHFRLRWIHLHGENRNDV